MKKDISKNFFQTKKELCMLIFDEIIDALKIDREIFLNEGFVDKKKFLIKGNKKIPLYNHSQTFSQNI